MKSYKEFNCLIGNKNGELNVVVKKTICLSRIESVAQVKDGMTTLEWVYVTMESGTNHAVIARLDDFREFLGLE